MTSLPPTSSGRGGPARTAPDSGASSTSCSDRRHDLGQVESDRLLELLEAARTRIAVVAPPDPLRSVAEPGALHVLIPDLDNPLGAQRHERQVFLRVPAAALRCPRMPGRVLGGLLDCSPVPRMALEPGHQRLYLLEQGLAH